MAAFSFFAECSPSSPFLALVSVAEEAFSMAAFPFFAECSPSLPFLALVSAAEEVFSMAAFSFFSKCSPSSPFLALVSVAEEAFSMAAFSFFAEYSPSSPLIGCSAGLIALVFAALLPSSAAVLSFFESGMCFSCAASRACSSAAGISLCRRLKFASASASSRVGVAPLPLPRGRGTIGGEGLLFFSFLSAASAAFCGEGLSCLPRTSGVSFASVAQCVLSAVALSSASVSVALPASEASSAPSSSAQRAVRLLTRRGRSSSLRLHGRRRLTKSDMSCSTEAVKVPASRSMRKRSKSSTTWRRLVSDS